MCPEERPIAWIHGSIRTPPFSKAARLHAGYLLRRLQEGGRLEMPHSRPMPTIGPHCHELRIPDGGAAWRIVYHLAPDAIVILAVFEKKSRKTPPHLIHACKLRLMRHEEEG